MATPTSTTPGERPAVPALARLAALAAQAMRTGSFGNDGRNPPAIPAPPADAQLIALCAELGTNERERRRIIAMIASQPDTRAGLARAIGMHPDLTRLTAERRALIQDITSLPALTTDGLAVKAGVVRLLIDDLPVPRNVRVEMARSLASDVIEVVA